MNTESFALSALAILAGFIVYRKMTGRGGNLSYKIAPGTQSY